MLDFGGDASDGKCQVRDDRGDCPDQAKFRIIQNPYTARDVCADCLAEALEFIMDKTHHIIISVFKI